MADTYTQIHLHFVFAVKFRTALIQRTWKEELHRYITSLIQHQSHKLLSINSMPDHIHILAGVRPHQSVAGLIQHVKTESSKWINQKRFCAGRFGWQKGYGAFSYGKSQLSHVIHYIQNQESHHQKETFLKEYERLLNAFDIAWNDQNIFNIPE